MNDKTTATLFMSAFNILSSLTAICRQLNDDNQRLLEETYLISQELKQVKSNIKQILWS